jgi:hypothetical protein
MISHFYRSIAGTLKNLSLTYAAIGLLAISVPPASAQPSGEMSRCRSIETIGKRLECLNATSRENTGQRQAVKSCYLNSCIWLRLQNQTTVQSNKTGVLVKVLADIGDSFHEVGHYDDPKPITWKGQNELYAFCSAERPAVLNRYDEGWNADVLAPGYPQGVYGDNKFSNAAYFLVCHGLTNVDLNDATIGPRLGYSARLVDLITEAYISDPLEIMDDSKWAAQPSISDKEAPPENKDLGPRFDAVFMQARACIRRNVSSVYQSGAYGIDQTVAFFATKCLGAFSKDLRELGMDDAIAATGFKALVFQEIAPNEWQKTIDSLKIGSRK